MPCQQSRIRFADPANPQRVDEPLQRNLPSRLDRARQVPRRDFAPALAACDLRLARRQSEDVGGTVQPALLVELADGLFAQSFDIEGGSRHEVDQPFDPLGLADQPAGTAAHSLAGRTYRVAAADRTDFGEVVRLAPLRPLFDYH